MMQNEIDALSFLPVYFLVATLLIATLSDVMTHRIPNKLLIPALAFALIASAVSGGITGLGLSLGGMGVGLAIMLPVYAVGGMAAGDVKLLAVAGAYLGPHGALLAGLFTFVAGAVLGLLWIVHRFLRPVVYKLLSRFAQSVLGISADLAYFNVEGKERTFAYAPAIAGGVALAFWQLGWQFPISLGG